VSRLSSRADAEKTSSTGAFRTFKRCFSPIVLTFYYARLRKDRELMETLQRHFAGKVAEPIRANVRLSEAPSHQMTICEVERVVNGD